MLNIPWWGWVALAGCVLILACMVASEVIEDRELRQRAEDLEGIDDETDEIAAPVAEVQEPAAEHADAAAAATSDRRVARYEPLPSVAEVIEKALESTSVVMDEAAIKDAVRRPSRQRKPAKPRSRKKASARKAKKARARR